LLPEEIERVRLHLVECSECCEKIDAIPEDSLLGLVRDAGCAKTSMLGDDPTSDDVKNDPAEPSPTPELTTPEELLPQLPSELHQHSRYVVLEKIGVGGMGDVFRAQHRLMDRSVAIKVINRDLVNHRNAAERFRREVRAAAALDHANIVSALDAEQEGDLHFLVMEYVDGKTLFELVASEGSLPIERACDYIRQAAQGLAHAHARGMVHRDIKPQNLMLTKDGIVKVLDFGLASLIETAPPNSLPSERSDLTLAGAVMGTPDYISPEQASDARQADIRSDLYSLGGTLYFLLTGQPPFAEGDVMDKLNAHAEKSPPAVDSIRIDIPGELAAVVRRLMAKHPADRYQTPEELAEALAPFVDRYRLDGNEPQATPRGNRRETHTEGIPARKQSSVGSVVLVVALLGIGMLGIACLTASLLIPVYASRREHAKRVEIVERQRATAAQQDALARQAQDQAHNAPTRNAPSTSTELTVFMPATKFPGIELVRLEDGASMSFPSSRGALEKDHDGKLTRRLQIRVTRGTWRVKMTGVSGEFIIDRPTFAAKPGGKVAIAIKSRNPIHVYSLKYRKDNGITPTLRQVRQLTGHKADITGLDVDSKRNLLVSSSSDGMVNIWNLTTGISKHRLGGQVTPCNIPVDIDDDGKKVVVGDRGGRLDFYELESGEASNIIDLRAGNLNRVAFSPDGSVVLGVDINGKIACCNFELPPFKGSGKVRDAQFSADGTRLYVVSENLHILDVESEKWIEEIELKTKCSTISVSKDGKHYAVGSVGGAVYLFEDGKKEPKFTLNHHTDGITDMAFSADGALLATGGYDQQLIVWDTAKGLEFTRAVNSRHIFNMVEFSADGRLITGGGTTKSGFSRDKVEGDFDIYEWDLTPLSESSIEQAEGNESSNH